MSAFKACVGGFGLIAFSSCAQAQAACGGGICLAGSPYVRDAQEIPGVVQAEHFDIGGEGVGYSDSTDGNSGTREIRDDWGVEDHGMRMDEDVDITQIELLGADWVVGWMTAGEFLRYTVNVTNAVQGFKSTFRVAAPSNTKASFRVVAGGTDCEDYTLDLTGLVVVRSTGEYYSDYEDFTKITRVGLPKGVTYIWLCVETGGFNLDYFTMEQDGDTPYVSGRTNLRSSTTLPK